MYVAPEVKLIMMLGGSAMMFHLTNSMFKSVMPNMNDVIKQNPGLVQNMMSAVQNTVPKSQQGASEPSVDENGRREMQGPGFDISSLMGNIMMPPQPPMNTTSINKPDDTEIDIEDDISDIAEPPIFDTVRECGDDEVREVKVTQTKSKKGGGKKKKTVEINL